MNEGLYSRNIDSFSRGLAILQGLGPGPQFWHAFAWKCVKARLLNRFMNTLLCSALYALISLTPSNQLIFNNAAEPETLDPHRLTALNDAVLGVNLFEGLLSRDASYVKLEPGLATKLPEVSKDGLTYTFQIRKNAKWSNGEPITLDQIRGSFVRALDPAVACPYVNWYTDSIEGAEELNKNFNSPNRKDFEAKYGVRVKGADKIEIRLKKPNVLFIEYLTQQPFWVVHPSMYDAASKAWTTPAQFVSNGPYKLKEWTVNKQVILEKNPNYWDSSIVKISEVVALPIGDYQTVYNLYRSGQLDWTGDNHIASSLVPSLRADPEFKKSLGFGTYTYVFNLKRKPFDDVRVRKALSLAIHRAEITDRIALGGQVPTNRLVPGGIAGYSPSIEPPLPFDKQIEKAKTLLAEAGYPEGKGFPAVTLLYNTNEGHHKIAQAIQQMWRKYLGIQSVRIQNMEWKVLIKEQQAKNFDMVRQSWIGDIPDPTPMLEIYMTGDGNNHSGWSNAKFDELIRKSRTLKDRKVRMKMLAEAEELLLSDAPMIPIYNYVYYGLISKRISGLEPNMFGIYQVKYFSKR